MNFRHFAILTALLALLPSGGLRAQAQSGWIALESDHFELYTDTNAEKGSRVLEDFEGRFLVFQDVFLPIRTRTPRIRIVLRDARQDFLEAVPDSMRPYLKAGYLLQGSAGAFFLVRDSSPESIAEDVGHSLGHLLLSKATLWQPFWLREGIGEYFSQLGHGGEDDAVAAEEGFGLYDLLRIVPSDSYNDLEEGGVFRRQAFHLLRIMLESYPQELARYLDSLRDEAGIDRTPELPEAAVEEMLAAYNGTRLTFEPAVTAAVGRPVPPGELDALLGDLAAVGGFGNRARDSYARSELEAARVGLARLGLRQRAARRTFEQLVEDFPESGLAHYYLGTLAAETEAERGAQIRALERAIELMPDSGRARAELAMLYALGGRADEAIPLVYEALDREPEFGDRFYEILAESELRRGNYDRAAECIQIAAYLPHSDSDPLSLERYDRLAAEFYRRMDSYRRDREADRLEELQREVDSLVEDVDPRPEAVVEEPAPLGRVSYAISSGEVPGVTAPELREAPTPEYSPDLRRRAVEGRVIVVIDLDRRGRIADLEIVRSDSPELASAVLEAVSRWRFDPARRNFESTAYSFRLTVNFYLE